MRSVYDAIKALFTIRPVTATATQTGSAVDTKGYNSAAVVLEVGTVSGTTPTLDVKVQECATSGGTYTDISGATFTQVTATDNSQILRIEGLGTSRQRYLKVVGTIAGTSPSFAFGVEILLGRAFREPVNA